MTLHDFFSEHRRAVLAFSGGTDSAYLLYAALKCGVQIYPVFVHTVFQPEWELRDAKRLAMQLSCPLEVAEVDILADADIVSNPADRCYRCKSRIMQAVRSIAQKYNCPLIIDGTNASDIADDRRVEIAARRPRDHHVCDRTVRGIQIVGKPYPHADAAQVGAGRIYRCGCITEYGYCGIRIYSRTIIRIVDVRRPEAVSLQFCLPYEIAYKRDLDVPCFFSHAVEKPCRYHTDIGVRLRPYVAFEIDVYAVKLSGNYLSVCGDDLLRQIERLTPEQRRALAAFLDTITNQSQN